MPRTQTILLALILTLLAVTIATAIRPIAWTSPQTIAVLGPGGLKIDHQTTHYATDADTANGAAAESDGDTSGGWRILNSSGYTVAYFLRPAWRQTHTDLRIVLPYWPIFIALAAPWIVLYRNARRQQKRRAAGACLHCGYDLKQTPTNRCPECGRDRSPFHESDGVES